MGRMVSSVGSVMNKAPNDLLANEAFVARPGEVRISRLEGL